MSRSKPPVMRLSDMQQGDTADFFAILAERTRSQTRDGKPYFACRFRDARRTVTFMVWLDGGLFEACQNDWKQGQCYKLRAMYGEHDRYGPQIDLQQIREVRDEDREQGFNPLEFVERTRFDPEAMFIELRALV